MLDLTKKKKEVLPIKLVDGTIWNLTAPKKKLYKELGEFKDELDGVDDPAEVCDSLTKVTAEILSNNLAGTSITPEKVDELIDIEDMALIITEYQKFASGLTRNPN